MSFSSIVIAACVALAAAQDLYVQEFPAAGSLTPITGFVRKLPESCDSYKAIVFVQINNKWWSRPHPHSGYPLNVDGTFQLSNWASSAQDADLQHVAIMIVPINFDAPPVNGGLTLPHILDSVSIVRSLFPRGYMPVAAPSSTPMPKSHIVAMAPQIGSAAPISGELTGTTVHGQRIAVYLQSTDKKFWGPKGSSVAVEPSGRFTISDWATDDLVAMNAPAILLVALPAGESPPNVLGGQNVVKSLSREAQQKDVAVLLLKRSNADRSAGKIRSGDSEVSEQLRPRVTPLPEDSATTASNVEKIKQNLLGKVGEFKQDVNERLSSLSSKANDAKQSIDAKVGDFKDDINTKVDAVKQGVNDRVDFVNIRAADIKHHADDKIGDVKQNINSDVDSIKQDVNDRVDFVNVRAADIKHHADDKVGDIKHGISSKVGAIKQDVSDRTDAVGVRVDHAGAKAGALEQEVADKLGDFKQAAAAQLEQFKQELAEEVGKITTVNHETISGFKKHAQHGVSQIAHHDAMWDKLGDKTTTGGRKLAAAGQAIGRRLADTFNAAHYSSGNPPASNDANALYAQQFSGQSVGSTQQGDLYAQQFSGASVGSTADQGNLYAQQFSGASTGTTADQSNLYAQQFSGASVGTNQAQNDLYAQQFSGQSVSSSSTGSDYASQFEAPPGLTQAQSDVYSHQFDGQSTTSSQDAATLYAQQFQSGQTSTADQDAYAQQFQAGGDLTPDQSAEYANQFQNVDSVQSAPVGAGPSGVPAWAPQAASQGYYGPYGWVGPSSAPASAGSTTNKGAVIISSVAGSLVGLAALAALGIVIKRKSEGRPLWGPKSARTVRGTHIKPISTLAAEYGRKRGNSSRGKHSSTDQSGREMSPIVNSAVAGQQGEDDVLSDAASPVPTIVKEKEQLFAGRVKRSQKHHVQPLA